MAKLGPRPQKGSPEYSQYFKDMGRMGGQANLAKHGKTHFSVIGARGGETMKRTRGRDFYSEIGKIGSKKQWGKEDEA